VFEIPIGAMGDRVGPRRVLAWIVLWWSAFTSLTGLAAGYVPLLVTRFFFGMGEAGALPNASAAVARWFPIPERPCLWSLVDVEPVGRRDCSLAGGADSSSLRMAGSLLPVRDFGGGLERGLV